MATARMVQRQKRRQSPHGNRENTRRAGSDEQKKGEDRALVLCKAANVNTHGKEVEAVGFGSGRIAAWEERLFQIQRAAKGLEDFAGLRDHLLDASDDLSICCNTLFEVAKAHFPSIADDPSWTSLRQVVAQQGQDSWQNRVETKGEKWRKRNLAIVRALWGSDVVQAYRMDEYSQQGMFATKRCATMCPNFADFVPKLNAVLLDRHQKAVRSARLDRLSNEKRLTGSDLVAAFDLLDGRNTKLSDVQADPTPWTSSSLGDFPVGPRLLRDWQPHFRSWLLATDEFGVLSPRSPASPTDGTASTGRRKRPRYDELHEDISAQLLPDSEADDSYSDSDREDISMTSTRDDPPSDDDENTDTSDGSPEQNDRVAAQPSSVAGTSKTCKNSNSKPPEHCPDQTKKAEDDVQLSENGEVGHNNYDNRPRSGSPPQILTQPSTPDLDPALASRPTTTCPGLTISAHPVLSDRCTIEESLHNKYAQEIQDYCRTLHHQSGKSLEHARRAQWLTPTTRYATIWGSTQLGNGDSNRSSADVLYYTSHDLIEDLQAGIHLDRPVVVKESFTDTSFHSIDSFRRLLSDSLKGKELDIRKLGNERAEKMSLHQFLTASQTASTAKGYNALNLRDIAKAQHPLFTLVSRLRLLDKIVENVRVHAGKEVVPVDVASCASFNIFALAGAFSGAHQDALTGTWVRCLDGLKFWMIIPPGEVDDTFSSTGHTWSPVGKERLIVLEQDDVLLMPPGIPVVHAVHSPRATLMSGGMLWDDLNVLQILQQLYTIGRYQLTTNEAIAYQLADVLNCLEKLVRTDPARYRGSAFPSNKTFLADFDASLRRVKSLGCCCSPCNATCSCSLAVRRCTSLCKNHPRLPPEMLPSRVDFAQFRCMQDEQD